MKKNIFLLVLCIFMVSCKDIIEQKEKDILKYDYLNPFMIYDERFIQGKLDLDNNILLYSYDVNNVESTMNIIDENAKKEGWKKEKDVYIKKININEYLIKKVKVSIKIDNKRIIFMVS